MTKLLQSRKFTFGVICLVASILITFIPQAAGNIDKIETVIGVVYMLLAFGTSFEDAFKAWQSAKSTDIGQLVKDILTGLEEVNKPVPSVSVGGTPTPIVLDPTAKG